MSTEDPTDGDAALLDELLAVVPRLVDRTRSQAEFARSFAALLPCVGPLLARRDDDPGPGVPEHERIDVLSVLSDGAGDGREAPDAGPATPADGPPLPVAAAVPVETAVPVESELPIQDYDSLAASQVVPRLSTLSPGELGLVEAYESATRRRQTILNRVAQLRST